MTVVTVELTPAQAELLAKRARKLGIAPDALAAAAVRELLSEPDEEFEEVAGRILDKNAELYRRLA